MKNWTPTVVLGAMTTLGLCIITAPVRADDPISNATTNQDTFGKVERADNLIGKEVYSSDNQKIGKIKDLVVDLESGKVLYAIVDAQNKVAVAPGVLQEQSADKNIHASVDKAKLEGAPQFTSDVDTPQTLAKSDFVSKVNDYFGQSGTAASARSFNNVHKASDIEGMKVYNQGNQDIGKVNNLALDLSRGRVLYVIFSPAYSLKLASSDLYALPPTAFRPSQDQKNLMCNVDQTKWSSAPHFAKNQWPDLSSPDYATQVYGFYGKQLWSQDGGIQPTGR